MSFVSGMLTADIGSLELYHKVEPKSGHQQYSPSKDNNAFEPVQSVYKDLFVGYVGTVPLLEPLVRF